VPYDGKLLARARDALDRQREANQAEQQRRIQQVYTRVPEIRNLDTAMRTQMMQLVRLTLSKRPDIREQIAALEKENLNMQARRAELLVAHGWPIDYLDEIVSCPLCRDTGFYRDGPCTCLEKLYNKELTRELSGLLRHGDESFERFNLNLYSDVPDPLRGPSPRQTMTITFAICKRFADSFPDVTNNLLLQGGTGLGKTFLSACIARTVAAKGCSVCYDSAATALDAFEKQKFSRDPAESEEADKRIKRMLSCDLMILDDLGTEMVTSLSQSALYSLLNGRLVAGKRMIFSTNLSDAELTRKYTPQIVSRLIGEFRAVPFQGEDIRRKER